MIDRLRIFYVLSASLAAASQPSAPAPVEAPLRELTWGQLNILHTTDTHGWHAGHLKEPSYSADWGDYISFGSRMRKKAEQNGQDLLIVDTGDRIEGNGLYDASEPKGKYTFDIFKEQDIDLICTGNHELYKVNSSENEYDISVPNFKNNYIASNVDIKDPRTGSSVPLAPRFKKFTTQQQGIRIMAFGFLYDFTENANNTIVHPVEETLKEKWFQDKIRDREIDLFLVIGHVPVQSPEYDSIFKAIRDVQWDAAIVFLGGHTHIRDYKKYDGKSVGLESGRFMETIGFQSIDGLQLGNGEAQIPRSPKFSRKYIDNNLFSFYHHTGLNLSTFPTEHGQNVSDQIKNARKSLNLDQVYGCAEQNLWVSRTKYPGPTSIFTWLEEHVLPEMVVDAGRANSSRFAMINTGAIRFDILKGPFTRDSTYNVAPFTNGFRYVKDVPYDKASKLSEILNSNGPLPQEVDPRVQSWMLAPIQQRFNPAHFHSDQSTQTYDGAGQVPLVAETSLTPGYTTTDDEGDDGDDTVHAPISFHRVPNVIQARIDPPSQKDDPKVVDVVYIEYIQPWVLLAFNFLDLDYSEKDTGVYMEGDIFTNLLADWVKANWKGDC